MYESPIEIVYGQMQTQIEGDILKAVQQVGVHVDKEELIRALQYDREQYEKGYQDAIRDKDLVEVVRCKDCKSWEQYNACDGTKPHRCMNSDSVFYKRTAPDFFCAYGERKDNDNK